MTQGCISFLCPRCSSLWPLLCVQAYIEKKGLLMISDEAIISAMVASVLQANMKELTDYRNGKTKLQGFFQGWVKGGGQGAAGLLPGVGERGGADRFALLVFKPPPSRPLTLTQFYYRDVHVR